MEKKNMLRNEIVILSCSTFEVWLLTLETWTYFRNSDDVMPIR